MKYIIYIIKIIFNLFIKTKIILFFIENENIKIKIFFIKFNIKIKIIEFPY
jgi:hypothetical protein